jgi:hypothetical protein
LISKPKYLIDFVWCLFSDIASDVEFIYFTASDTGMEKTVVRTVKEDDSFQ